MSTKKQKANIENLAKEYASMVFGIEPRQDIQNIKNGVSGPFQVKDDINIDGKYIFQTLTRDGKPIADNDPEKLTTHKAFFKNANGRVLISGLGLGNSLHEVLKKNNVKSITIVEHAQDIINLVGKSFKDPRVKIIQGDIFGYIPKEHFDCIYHAIWSNKKEALSAAPARKKLKKKLAPFCSWQGFAYISPRGGTRKGAGRIIGTLGPIKTETEKRTVKKGVRYTPKEFEVINRACALSGKSASEIAVMGAIKEATRIVFGVKDSMLDELVKKTIP